MMDQHLIFDETCLDELTNLKNYHNRFQALDKIQAYMNSDKFISHPLNNKRANFGNQ